MNNQILKEDVRLFAEQFELCEELRSKKFLITGATGLIGYVLIKCLLELNRRKNLCIRIVAVVCDMGKARNIFLDDFPSVDFRQVALTDIRPESVGNDIDYIVHLASPTASKYFVEHLVETMCTSIDGTTAVLRLAKDTGAKSVIYASSLEVYGRNHTDEPLAEDFQGYVNPTEVRSSYNVGKRACECLCHAYTKEYGVPVKIARLTQTTGADIANDDNRVITQFARLAAGGKDIVLHTTGEAARPYCYTTDAISAILYILLKGAFGETYNVANEETYISARGMAEYLRDNFNPKINVRIELNNNMGYAPVTKLRLSAEKLMALGWKPKYGLNEIFERLIASMK